MAHLSAPHPIVMSVSKACAIQGPPAREEVPMEVERRGALSAVQQAVCAYVRDPSPAPARQVEMASRRIRQLDSVARWRHGTHRPADRLAS
jgi:hypothetical protein